MFLLALTMSTAVLAAGGIGVSDLSRPVSQVPPAPRVSPFRVLAGVPLTDDPFAAVLAPEVAPAEAGQDRGPDRVAGAVNRPADRPSIDAPSRRVDAPDVDAAPAPRPAPSGGRTDPRPAPQPDPEPVPAPRPAQPEAPPSPQRSPQEDTVRTDGEPSEDRDDHAAHGNNRMRAARHAEDRDKPQSVRAEQAQGGNQGSNTQGGDRGQPSGGGSRDR